MRPETTKLRILRDRAQREHEAVQLIEYEARRKFENASIDYLEACRAEGFCGACEQTLDSCQCVSVGGLDRKTIFTDDFLAIHNTDLGPDWK